MRSGVVSAAAAAIVACAVARAETPLRGAHDLGELSLEQLAAIEVSTVSGRAEPLARAMASVYVITNEDIIRSGATSIPEALRLAPNLEVAQTAARTWAISARGFNDTLANKLLLLVDGRAVYSPTFSGVFWDALDVMLDDVDRIEVISGPGGVLWGANAVDGVINILTKPTADTRRGLATARAGTDVAQANVRWGGEAGTYRVYAQGTRRDDTDMPDGTENHDGQDFVQAGFRAERESGANAWTVQGDGYTAEDNAEPDPAELHGFNVLGRYRRDLGAGSELRAQAYYDFSERPQQHLDTFDLEVAHALRAYGRHTLLWGAGFRQSRDRIDNGPNVAFFPEDRTLNKWDVYLQDVVAVASRVDLTVGARVEHNTYTGIELMPSVRAGWRVRDESLIWAAISRAVRTPARLDRDLAFPGEPPFLLIPNDTFQSEIFYTYELGYRGQINDRLSWSATLWYDDLHDLRSVAPTPAGAVIANDRQGHTAGLETWGAFRATAWCRLWLGYDYLDKSLSVRPGTVDLQQPQGIGADPKQWANFRAAFDIGKAVQLDLFVRFVDELDTLEVPSYTAVDLHLGWNVSRRVELSATLRNALDAGHIEWTPGAELARTASFQARVRF